MAQRLGARTTRVYTLLPPALGGIVSIRDLGGGSAHGVTNTDTWYAYDRLGSVMLTSDAAGTPAALRWQDAYGNELASELTGSWATPAAGEGYGLTTKWYDGDAEMYYFWQRWLDPSVGRFVLRDPESYSEGPLLYQFNWANPIARLDIDGRQSVRAPSGRTTWREKLWGLFHPNQLNRARGCQLYADGLTRSWFDLTDRDGIPDSTPANALRHCLWACCLRLALGPRRGWLVLERHEDQNADWMPDDSPETSMDRHNNRIGSAGAQCPGETCYEHCTRALHNGRLITGLDDPRI